MPAVPRRLPIILILLPVLLACGGEPRPALQVGGVSYAADEVATLSPELLRSLADLTAFGQAAARGELVMLGEPLMQRAGERGRVQALPLYLAAREMGIGEVELRAAYAERPEWSLTVRHLVRLVPRAAVQEERLQAWTRAEEARRRAVGGDDFTAVAAEFSEEPGAAERGGLLQPGREGTWVGPFWEAALALQPGEVSPVVETEYGYHVIRLEEREPVPFGEADPSRLLAALVPEARAVRAMEQWLAARADALTLQREAVRTARDLFAVGQAPDTLVLARWTHPEGEREQRRYTAQDLAVFRAALEGEERERLERAGAEAMVNRAEADAREAMWADAAEGMGVPASEAASAAARHEWEGRAIRWAQALGFREGMSEEEIRATALRGLAGRGQELRITRSEIAGMRPLLWRRYGVSGTAVSAPVASSNSATRNSETTR